jgi:hypothetical protein
MDVRMKHNLAGREFQRQLRRPGVPVRVFQWATNRAGTRVGPLGHAGGIAISQHSVLFGGNDCDYDGVIYEKGGRWRLGHHRTSRRQRRRMRPRRRRSRAQTMNYALVTPHYGWRGESLAAQWYGAELDSVRNARAAADSPVSDRS